MNLIQNVVGKIFIIVLLLAGCTHASATKNEVCIREQCFDVEVALTEDQMAKGLQFRETLPMDEGMIFVFQKDRRHSFWMKDTWISLDMIWINADEEIVHIESHVPPCEEWPCPNYKPKKPSRYVFEINAGLAEQYGFSIGDRVDIRLQPLERLP